MQLTVPDVLENYIGGVFRKPSSEMYMDNINPSTNEIWCRIPDSDNRDVELAVEAAAKALELWRNTSPESRFGILNKIADSIDANLETLSLAESNDTGKPVFMSRTIDIPRASSNFRFFATGIMHFSSESHSLEGKVINYTLRQPLGIVGCISPWNLPLYLFTWKIAPALAAGNCVIAKPSEITPVTAFLLAKICEEAGLPAGVLNILHGTGNNCGEAMVKHPKIKAISFTGSTRAGARIAEIAAPKFKKLSLELGGKNPNIIFADCDWKKMMASTLQSSFSNQGQICLCGSRILIESSIYEKFKSEFVKNAKAIVPSDPLFEECRQGSVVSEIHFNKIIACIDKAKDEGGKILCGGQQVKLSGRCEKGFFIAPTVIEGLGPSCETNREEIFGPVVTLQPFDSEAQALELANNSQYGLSATIWTQDITKANRIVAKVESGIIWINCWMIRDLRTPFGGMKNSGVGREGGWEALRFFTEAKNVCIEI